MGAGKGAYEGTHKHGDGKGIVNDPMVGKREGRGCRHRDGADLQCACAFEKGLTKNENQDIDDKGRRTGSIKTAIDADEQTEKNPYQKVPGPQGTLSLFNSKPRLYDQKGEYRNRDHRNDFLQHRWTDPEDEVCPDEGADAGWECR